MAPEFRPVESAADKLFPEYSTPQFPDMDYGSQIQAIRRMLNRNKAVEEESSKNIAAAGKKARETSGWQNEYNCGQYTDRCQEFVYEGIAHSMAAVGMIAPLMETVFFRGFLKIGAATKINPESQSEPARWKSAGQKKWDCYYVWEKGKRRKGILNGIKQLVKDTGMGRHFPKDLNQTLQALSCYRNKMFHCGLEWPEDERKKFGKRAKDERWPEEWFEKATVGDQPWVFFMSDAFIDHCLDVLDEVASVFNSSVAEDAMPTRVEQDEK